MAWAWLERTFTAGEFSNPEGSKVLRDQLFGAQDMDSDILTAEGTEQPVERPRQPVNETMDDVADLMALMRPPEVQEGD